MNIVLRKALRRIVSDLKSLFHRRWLCFRKPSIQVIIIDAAIVLRKQSFYRSKRSLNDKIVHSLIRKQNKKSRVPDQLIISRYHANRMDRLHKGWFTEFSPDDASESAQSGNDDDKQLKSDGVPMGGAWPGQAFSLQVNKILFHEKSKYQDVLVFESRSYGNVLVLDGIIQCTERDEFAYQEMLAHLSMFAHRCPKKVLIIGGGDGGILREVLKHDCVESVSMCEIDEMVINISKKFLPHMSVAFNNPKLNLFIGDGFEFLKGHENEFDVVITDSSDPIGPAECLFGQSYYQLIKNSLRKGGVLASQGECPWLDTVLLRKLSTVCGQLFESWAYATGSVPTYTTGLMGYFVCSKDEKRDLSIPAREISDSEIKKMGLRYYNSSIHRAAFILPQFIKEAFDSA